MISVGVEAGKNISVVIIQTNMSTDVKIIGGFMIAGLVILILIIFFQKSLKPNNDLFAPTPAINLGEKIQEMKKTPTPTKQEIQNVTQLQIKDDQTGTGDEAVIGKKVTVNYQGFLLDGTKFDSSYERGTPFTFTLGAGEVIKGWDQGVVGMKIGGKRRLLIPPDLAYGSQGAGNAIPPNSSLVFAIELLKVE